MVRMCLQIRFFGRRRWCNNWTMLHTVTIGLIMEIVGVKAFYFFILVTFLRFFIFSTFFILKTLTKRYTNDEKHL